MSDIRAERLSTVLEISYELHGEQASVQGCLVEDGGVYFRFVNGKHVTPLRLSARGIEAAMALYQELLRNPKKWTESTISHPPEETADSSAQGE